MRRLLLVCALSLQCFGAAVPPAWTETTNGHFHIYSQGRAEDARVTLLWFEQIEQLFQQSGIAGTAANSGERKTIRVIGFRSPVEYRAFRLRETADAYYVGASDRDYIVLPGLGQAQFALAAHEYTHLLLHASKLQLPVWLSEGLAEFFSSIRISEGGGEAGGELPMRMQTLRNRKWLPLSELTSADKKSPIFANRDEMGIFYAQSWALATMFVSANDYAPGFPAFLRSVARGTATTLAIAIAYRKSLATVMEDLRTFVAARRFTTVSLKGASAISGTIQTAAISDDGLNEVLADLLMTDGEIDRAEAIYQELARSSSANRLAILAALGTIALQRGDRVTAERDWRLAMNGGLADADLCYRYGQLASDAGDLDPAEIRRALERAIVLRPKFDDAHYRLALLESNAGDYGAALENLRAMSDPQGERAFPYWCTKAYILTELDKREEARQAAGEALKHAANAADRARAEQLAFFAETDLHVEITQGADGKTSLATTRVPHGTTDFNPFVEPGDSMRRAEGTLREVECRDGRLTALVVATASGPLRLAVPDAGHVLSRGGPMEFACGAQTARNITVEYAAPKAQAHADGVLRALALR